VLELAETGRHDEIFQSVVAHNARRRVQRKRARRNRYVARLASRAAAVVVCGLGAYAFVLLADRLFNGAGQAHATLVSGPPTADAATAVVATRGAGLAGRSALPRVTPNPRIARPHGAHQPAVRGAVDTGAKAAVPVTASIASIRPRHQTPVATHRPATKHKAKAKANSATVSSGAALLAEADAAKGTRATALEATIPDPTVATFTISATRGSAFVEVRLKGSTGPLVNKGVVPKGETITFSNKVLWVKVYSPGRLDLSVNGKPWRPTGRTVVATLSPTGVRG
jgi:hypothetical protein